MTSHLITLALLPLITAVFLRQANARARKNELQFIVEYPMAVKLFAVVNLIPVLYLIYRSGDAKPDAQVIMWTVIGCWGLGGIYLLFEFFGVVISFDDAHIDVRAPWRKRREIPWNDVQSIRYSKGMQWWVVDTASHGKVRLHQYMRGIPEFLAMAEKKTTTRPES